MVKELYMDECNELETIYERDVMNWDFVEEKIYHQIYENNKWFIHS